MPLKISDTGPSGLTSLNRWADEKEQDIAQNKTLVQQHAAAIQQIQKQIVALQKVKT